MALEASDMSDGAILEGTQQFQNGNGQVQFRITLPSGRELESEWLQPDMKKKAMVAWLDVVKAEALNDADQARAEAREQAMQQRRNAELQQTAPTPEPGSTAEQSLPGLNSQTTGTRQTAIASVTAPAFSQAPLVQTSPDDFIAAGLKSAQADYYYWNSVALEAALRLAAARQNIDKWTNIKKALEGNATHDSGNRPGAGSGSAGTGPKRMPRKRRVAKSTDYTAPGSPNEYDIPV